MILDDRVDEYASEEAAFMISDYLVKYGRIGVIQTKVKFGSVRVYCHFGFYSFHSVTHPGYMYSQYPKWLSRLDLDLGSRVMKVLNKIIVPYHRWLYRRAYERAINKFPYIKDNILMCADYPELLNGLRYRRER